MIGLTKKEEKLIVSLQQKKFRKTEGLFFVEGIKMVEEALKSDFKVCFVVAAIDFDTERVPLKTCDAKTMHRISAFKTAPGVVAVVELPTYQKGVYSDITLLAEKIQDPGNLGTIIRTADALGVKEIVCSPDCVDFFSPKVVQASMGSIFRTRLVVKELIEYVEKLPSSTPIYAAHLDGDDLYAVKVESPLVLAIGNESKGLSNELTAKVTQKVKIPMQGDAESFNVSIATAIILSECRRQLS